MSHPATGSLRVFRAAMLGSVAFALALSAHVVAGGQAPSMAVCLVLATVCGGVCVGVTARRLGLVVLTTTLGVLQLGLHYSFMWLTSGGCVTGSPTGVAPMRMLGGPAQMLACTPMAAGAMASMTHVPTGLMLGAHAVATMATALVLAQGERVLWLLVSAVWTVFHAVGRVLVSPAERRSEPGLIAGVGRGLVALGGIGRRGPPAPRLFV
jgi:hypothetical protein